MLDSPSCEPRNLPRAQRAPAKTILVVDDDFDHREAVRDTLENEGYLVRTAANGRDALYQLLGGPLPDLILLDLLMPVMDGSAFMAELKLRPELAAIPVVAISAGSVRVLYATPASGYLSKPVGAWRLLGTIASCLSRWGRAT
jgi:CheY-like chemotaxis protein